MLGGYRLLLIHELYINQKILELSLCKILNVMNILSFHSLSSIASSKEKVKKGPIARELCTLYRHSGE